MQELRLLKAEQHSGAGRATGSDSSAVLSASGASTGPSSARRRQTSRNNLVRVPSRIRPVRHTSPVGSIGANS